MTELSIHDFARYVKDKTVAFVGMSPIIKGEGFGAEIDSFDIVYRTNMYPLAESLHEDYGSRCDIISYQKYYLHLAGQFYNHGVLIQVPHLSEKERSTFGYPFFYVSRSDREAMAEKIKAAVGQNLLYPSSGLVAWFICAGCRRFKYFGVTGYQDLSKKVANHSQVNHYIEEYKEIWGERKANILSTKMENYHVHNFEAQNMYLSMLLKSGDIEMDLISKQYFT